MGQALPPRWRVESVDRSAREVHGPPCGWQLKKCRWDMTCREAVQCAIGAWARDIPGRPGAAPTPPRLGVVLGTTARPAAQSVLSSRESVFSERARDAKRLKDADVVAACAMLAEPRAPLPHVRSLDNRNDVTETLLLRPGQELHRARARRSTLRVSLLLKKPRKNKTTLDTSAV